MISNLFNFDQLSAISISLIIFISLIVAIYSKNYLGGDRKKFIFLLMIFFITTSLMITFSADNVFLICTSWMISNLILVLMMIYKKSWKQSVLSGKMALKNFAIGSVSLIIALTILSIESSSYSIVEIVNNENISKNSLIISATLILIAAMTQSALYPFHSWLISSLNSPTPSSAIMHAGLVNGGGIILARFSQLFFHLPNIMTVVFVLGMVSAIIGTLWKLVQSNVKGMLACSTMSQMGFMIAQCGMGLFPAAIAHLFWHGMFKSYLFLSSPSSWQEKRLDLIYPPKISSFLASLFCGIVGALIFAKINEIDIRNFETTLVLVALAFVAASQVALTIINQSLVKNFMPALVISGFLAAIYASSVVFIEKMMPPVMLQPQDLNIWHIIALVILVLLWFVRLFVGDFSKVTNLISMRIYVKILNSSQAKSQTITSNRNQYNYR